jgi:hypothetical protein
MSRVLPEIDCTSSTTLTLAISCKGYWKEYQSGKNTEYCTISFWKIHQWNLMRPLMVRMMRRARPASELVRDQAGQGFQLKIASFF